ncbi:MAG: fumarylacetoacetate hydrolase family protein [Acidobacteriota bacterium]|nr:fumarylacetoacetate hydrolase family protein [Acidobacteriota bacterium]
MKLVTFVEGDKAPRAGLVVNDRIVDLAGEGFADALAFVAAPHSVQADCAGRRGTVALAAARLVAPIARPPRIFGIGLNYQEHAVESNMKVQAVPTVFLKLSSSVVGPEAPVVLPAASSQVDYEAELAVVIGRAGYKIAAAQAEEHIFGYTIVNDVSARDIQLSTSQWSLGKSFPSFTPMGPWIVSKDEVGDAHALGIQITVSAEVLQDSNTSLLIFRIPRLIEYISGIVPLEVGDVISTGTPPGVGMGRSPQRWLRPGDEMVIRIEGIGELRNPVVAE